MGKFKIALVETGQEARWRKYWITSEPQGSAAAAPSGLGRAEIVEAATVADAVEAVQRTHPDCTIMLAGAEHHVA